VPALDKVFTALSKVLDDFVEGKGLARFIKDGFNGIVTAATPLAKGLDGIVTACKDGKASAVALVATLGALTAAFVTYRAITAVIAGATKAWAAAQAVLNAAMAANPVVLV